MASLICASPLARITRLVYLPLFTLCGGTLPMGETEIIATLGPATESAEMITRLIEAGMDVFRCPLRLDRS